MFQHVLFIKSFNDISKLVRYNKILFHKIERTWYCGRLGPSLRLMEYKVDAYLEKDFPNGIRFFAVSYSLCFFHCDVNFSFGRRDNTSTENLFSDSAVKPPPKVRLKVSFLSFPSSKSLQMEQAYETYCYC